MTTLRLVHDATPRRRRPTPCPPWCDRWNRERFPEPHAEHWQLIAGVANAPAAVDLAGVERDDSPHVQIEFFVPVRGRFVDLTIEQATALRDMLTEGLRLTRPLRLVRS
jgi:hypothetical protein